MGLKTRKRSALEWILDRYKEKKPKDPTIRERFNTYRFADYKEKVIDLLMRVTTVSVQTVDVAKKVTTRRSLTHAVPHPMYCRVKLIERYDGSTN